MSRRIEQQAAMRKSRKVHDESGIDLKLNNWRCQINAYSSIFFLFLANCDIFQLTATPFADV